MFTADQIVAHFVGDFLLQNDWMAREKGHNSFACLVHVCFYSLPFLLITQSPTALAVIVGTHFAIDRWGLVRMLIWARNAPFPDHRSWRECRGTGGFHPHTPEFLALFLYIVFDNVVHIVINGLAIHYLG